MSTLHGIKSKYYSNKINNLQKVNNSNKLSIGQTWKARKESNVRYRILDLDEFNATVYIYHRLNGKSNRLKKFRRTSAQFGFIVNAT